MTRIVAPWQRQAFVCKALMRQRRRRPDFPAQCAKKLRWYSDLRINLRGHLRQQIFTILTDPVEEAIAIGKLHDLPHADQEEILQPHLRPHVWSVFKM